MVGASANNVKLPHNDIPSATVQIESGRRSHLGSISGSRRKNAAPSTSLESIPLAGTWTNSTTDVVAFGCTPLHGAASQGDLDAVAMLLANDKTDVNAVDGEGWSSLHRAVKAGHAEMVKAFLEDARTNVNLGGGFVGCTALHLAAKLGSVEVLRTLLQHPTVNVNAVEKDGSTALHVSTKELCKRHGADRRMAKCIRALVEHPGLNVNKPDMFGHTALSHAVRYGCKETLRVILQHCQAPNRLNLDTAAADEMRSVRETIMDRFPELKPILPPPLMERLDSSSPQQRLLAAIQQGDFDLFCELLKRPNIDINYWYDEPYYCTPLELSCTLEDRQEFVRLLINAGANVNTVNPVSDVPLLHMTAKRGNLENLGTLLTSETINLNIKDCCQRTVLHCLARIEVMREDEMQVVQQCLAVILDYSGNSHRVEIDATDEWGNAALHVAARHGHSDTVATLLFHGADVNATDGSGETALHVAGRDGNPETVIQLLKHGADVMFTKFREPPLAQIDRVTFRRYLDECIETNGRVPQHQDFRFTFKYDFLTPRRRNKHLAHHEEEMPPLLYMSGDRRLKLLLKHPVITSFLHLKWNLTRHIFYINLFFYCLFLAFLTLHVIFKDFVHISDSNAESLNGSVTTVLPEDPVHADVTSIDNMIADDTETISSVIGFDTTTPDTIETTDASEQPPEVSENRSHVTSETQDSIVASASEDSPPHYNRLIPESEDWSTTIACIRIILIVLLIHLMMKQMFQFISATKQYLLAPSTILHLTIIVTSAMTCLDWQSSAWRHCAAIAVLLSWMEFLLLIGCLPALSVQLAMLKTVSWTFVKYMSCYCPLMLAFSFSFYILFHGTENDSEGDSVCSKDNSIKFYEKPWSSIMKSVLMLAGEFEASDLDFSAVPYTSHFIMIFFVLIVTVILLNLLSGLAVSDTQSIKDNAEILSLIARVHLISSIEHLIIGAAHSKLILPRLIKLVAPNLCSVFRCYPKKEIHIFPNRTKGKIFMDDMEPRLNVPMGRSIIKSALALIAKRNSMANWRGGFEGLKESKGGRSMNDLGGSSGPVSKKLKELCEQLGSEMKELRERHEGRLEHLEREIEKFLTEVSRMWEQASLQQERKFQDILRSSEQILERHSSQVLQMEKKLEQVEQNMAVMRNKIDQVLTLLLASTTQQHSKV